jgi:outer membrane receptor for ferrienterochelin and colicins
MFPLAFPNQRAKKLFSCPTNESNFYLAPLLLKMKRGKNMHTLLLKSGLLVLFASTALSSHSFAAKSAVQAETMTITATRTDTLLKDAPGAITAITDAEIREQPARDIVDILTGTAGISLLGRGVGGRKTISIRGSENRHTMILVDGRRIAASDAVMGHSNFENSWIPLENIERVEVVRGPLSSLYGSEALGGVVNIITRPPTDQWRGGFKIGGGILDDSGGDSTDIGVNFSGPLIKNRLGISLALEHAHEKATPDEDSPQYTEIEGRKILSFSPKLVLTLNKDHQFELFATLTDEERDYLSSFRGRDVDYLYELKKYMVGLGWNGKIGPTQSKLSLYKSRIDKLSIKTYLDTGSSSEAPDIATNEVLDGQTSFEFFGNLVTLGGEYRLESIQADSLADIGGKDEVTHKALFIQDEIGLFGDRLLLTPGVRYDNHEFFGSEISPRLYALLKITEQWNLKAGYGHAFNAPTVKQVSPGYNASTGPHSFIGNPDVDPETSDSYEIGVEYFGDSVTAKAFYFYNDITDLIAWNRVGSTGPGGRFGIFQAHNVAEALIQGVEAEVQAELPYGFDIAATYNYLDAEDTENNIPLSGRPEHSVGFKVKYSFDSLGLNTILRYQYTGKQAFENDADEMEEVSGYSLWHAAINKKLTSSLDLQLGIENIGDERLADSTDLFPYEERGRFFYTNLRGRF